MNRTKLEAYLQRLSATLYQGYTVETALNTEFEAHLVSQACPPPSEIVTATPARPLVSKMVNLNLIHHETG